MLVEELSFFNEIEPRFPEEEGKVGSLKKEIYAQIVTSLSTTRESYTFLDFVDLKKKKNL